MWMPLAYIGFALASAGLIWMAGAVISCFSRDLSRQEWAFDNAPRAWLTTFAGWACVVLSGIPLLLR
jgi:hypothetical protein